jgi:adenosylcobinamide-GDP ribazoletransferase
VPRPLAVAFAFLTRLPIARGPVDARSLGSCVAWFPAVGAALGATQLVAAHLLDALSPSVLAVALVALHAALTGGLHLDGIADVFDALGGGRGQRDRMLAILRDSRIGAHGALALILVLAGKLVATADLLARDVLWPLYAAPITARWAVVPLIVAFPCARPDGLGRSFHDHARAPRLAVATALTAVLLLHIGSRAVAPFACAAIAALALALHLHRRLGGLTGDVYGAAIECAELVFLTAASIIAGGE